MGKGIHGWIGGPGGSPTEYGLPLDDSYLHEQDEARQREEEDAYWDRLHFFGPQECPCQGQDWSRCACQPMSEDEEDSLIMLMAELEEVRRADEEERELSWRPAA